MIIPLIPFQQTTRSPTIFQFIGIVISNFFWILVQNARVHTHTDSGIAIFCEGKIKEILSIPQFLSNKLLVIFREGEIKEILSIPWFHSNKQLAHQPLFNLSVSLLITFFGFLFKMLEFTRSWERNFSALSFIKNKRSNKLGVEFLVDLMLSFLEKDLVNKILCDDILMERVVDVFKNLGNGTIGDNKSRKKFYSHKTIKIIVFSYKVVSHITFLT